MKATIRAALVLPLLSLAACGLVAQFDGYEFGGDTDAGVRDGGVRDAGSADAGLADAAAPDRLLTDAQAPPDGGTTAMDAQSDAAPSDAGTTATDAGTAATDTGPAAVDAGSCSGCDDVLPCTTDSCASGHCVHDVQSGWCMISGSCTRSGALSATGCRTCDPDASPRSWSPVPDGTACNDRHDCTNGETCSAGNCQGGSLVSMTCLIDGRCEAAGAGADGCSYCDPRVSPTAWLYYADGHVCLADPGVVGECCGRACFSLVSPLHCGTCARVCGASDRCCFNDPGFACSGTCRP